MFLSKITKVWVSQQQGRILMQSQNVHFVIFVNNFVDDLKKKSICAFRM